MTTDYVEVQISGIRCRVDTGEEGLDIFELMPYLKCALQGAGYAETTVNKIFSDQGDNSGRTVDIYLDTLADQWGHNSFGGFQATFHRATEGSFRVYRCEDGSELRLHFGSRSKSKPTQGWDGHSHVLYSEGQTVGVENFVPIGEVRHVRACSGTSIDDAKPAEWDLASRSASRPSNDTLDREVL